MISIESRKPQDSMTRTSQTRRGPHDFLLQDLEFLQKKVGNMLYQMTLQWFRCGSNKVLYNVRSNEDGRKYLSLAKRPTYLESFCARASIWPLKFRHSSSIIPKNQMVLTLDIVCPLINFR